MEGVTLVTMAFTLEGGVKSVGAMIVAQQILNVTAMEIANVRTAPVAKSATSAIGTSLTSHQRDVSKCFCGFCLLSVVYIFFFSQVCINRLYLF